MGGTGEAVKVPVGVSVWVVVAVAEGVFVIVGEKVGEGVRVGIGVDTKTTTLGAGRVTFGSVLFAQAVVRSAKVSKAVKAVPTLLLRVL